MSRHVIDTPKPRDEPARLREFTRVEREAKAATAPAALHARPKGERSAARMKRFLEIERNQTD